MTLPPVHSVMLPIAAGSARPAATLPGASIQPHSLPSASARVEWYAAVQPVEAALRAFRPGAQGKADPDLPTGPPPAFAANMLDRLPDSLLRARDTTQGANDSLAVPASDPQPHTRDVPEEPRDDRWQTVAPEDDLSRPAHGNVDRRSLTVETSHGPAGQAADAHYRDGANASGTAVDRWV